MGEEAPKSWIARPGTRAASARLSVGAQGDLKKKKHKGPEAQDEDMDEEEVDNEEEGEEHQRRPKGI